MNKWLVIALAICALVSGMAQAAGDAAAGKTKSAACAACHGMDGNSVNPQWPRLAGQSEQYIVKQLADFKEGRRKDPLMSGNAMGLSEQDMQDLGAYYAQQTAGHGQADPDLVKLGGEIYRAGNKETGLAACMSCHGPAGEGNPAANFPALRGQHAPYTEKQLSDFKSGQRSNDQPGKMMNTLVLRMTEQEMKAVASFISGLH